MESEGSSANNKKKDIAWRYGTQGVTKDKVSCLFCQREINGGINRFKHHLVGGNRNVKACAKVPLDVKEEIRAYMEGKSIRSQMMHEPSFVDVDEMDEVDEMMPPPSKFQKTSSSGSTTKGPLNLYFKQKPQGSGSSEKSKTLDQTKDILRERALSAFASWVYDAGLPFNCVNYPSFGKFIEMVGQFGPGMKPPTYHEVRVTQLKKEVDKVKEIEKEHEMLWSQVGCSIMMDKWTAHNGKILINVLVNSTKGSVFLKSINVSNESTNSLKMFKLFEKTIEKIGPQNVVQIVTDNASENKAAARMISGIHPHIFWTPCAAHCINLIFGDIFKIKPFESVYRKAVKVVSYIYQKPLLLNLMRTFTKEQNLVKPAKTRFATAFLTLHSMYMQKKHLISMVVSDEWTRSSYAKEVLGKDLAITIVSPTFWNNVVHALKVGGPLIKVLRMVDGEKQPPMGYIYEAMDRAKEAIDKAFEGNTKKFEKVFAIIDKRWSDQLHQPLHAAGHILNPSLYYTNDANKSLDREVWRGYHDCVSTMIYDTEQQDQIAEELPMFRKAEGQFGIAQAIRLRSKLSPGK